MMTRRKFYKAIEQLDLKWHDILVDTNVRSGMVVLLEDGDYQMVGDLEPRKMDGDSFDQLGDYGCGCCSSTYKPVKYAWLNEKLGALMEAPKQEDAT